MDHYGCQPERTNARCANENGDVESSNGHIKDRIDQALLLRGSRDFASRDDYMSFVEQIIATANANRQPRYCEEQSCLQRLPDNRLPSADLLRGIRVTSSSTIQVRTNTYSVPSRLIGRQVDVRIEVEQIEVAYQGHPIQTMPRLYGKKGVSINYRHIIDSLVRKPGAFANYRFREEMFPTSQFRIAYDMLRDAHSEKVADKQYVQILELAARESQDAVVDALRMMIVSGSAIDVEQVRAMVQDAANLPLATDLEVEPPNLTDYDSLLSTFDKECQSDEQKNEQRQSDLSQSAPHQDASFENPLAALCEPTPAQSQHSADRAVPRVADAELSRSLCPSGSPRSNRESEPSGLSFGTDDAGVRGPAGRPDQTLDDAFQTPAGQDVGIVRLQSNSLERQAANGDASGRILFESPGECLDLWEAGFGEKSCLVWAGSAIDSAGAQSVVYDLQPVGSTVVDCQAGLATAQVVQAAFHLRGLDHRRPGLCTTEPRGDGSLVHVAGRALRARKRPTDQQLGIQQMGPDLQGCDDDGRGDRPLGPSQCDHRTQRTQLPNRDRQKFQSNDTNKTKTVPLTEWNFEFLPANSNCR